MRSGLLLPAGLLLLGAALIAVSWIFAPGPFAFAWLAAMFVLLGWPLGSMALLLIHSLTGGRWGEAVRAPLLLGTVMLPLALLAAVPVGIFFPVLYPWMHPAAEQVLYNSWYLNVPFYAGRAVAYLVIWVGLAILTVLGSIGRGPALAKIAPPALIVLALTVTFASFDLTLSLDPHINSSVYGMLTGTGMTLLALSIAVLFAVPVTRGVARDDLGKLLLALCILWTYLDFVQLLVIWASNLEADAPWYAKRFEGFWGWALGAMSLLHGVAALILLGVPMFRRIDAVVLGLCVALIVSAVLRGWWLVLPEATGAPGLVDLACALGLAALACGALLLALRWPLLRRERAHV